MSVDANEILDLDWNSEDQKIQVPTPQASKIISSMRLLLASITDFFSKADLSFIFGNVQQALIELLFSPIKTSLVIKREGAFKLLCDELDFLGEGIREILDEKIGISSAPTEKAIREIEAIKIVFLTS